MRWTPTPRADGSSGGGTGGNDFVQGSLPAAAWTKAKPAHKATAKDVGAVFMELSQKRGARNWNPSLFQPLKLVNLRAASGPTDSCGIAVTTGSTATIAADFALTAGTVDRDTRPPDNFRHASRRTLRIQRTPDGFALGPSHHFTSVSLSSAKPGIEATLRTRRMAGSWSNLEIP